MTGADDVGIIDRWKRAAEAEPDVRHRSDYGGLAKVFADVADRKPLWASQLKEWNVKRSSVVEEWRTEGRAEALWEVLEVRFESLPTELTEKIQQATDKVVLRNWLILASRVGTLDEFRAQSGL